MDRPVIPAWVKSIACSLYNKLTKFSDCKMSHIWPAGWPKEKRQQGYRSPKGFAQNTIAAFLKGPSQRGLLPSYFFETFAKVCGGSELETRRHFVGIQPFPAMAPYRSFSHFFIHALS